MSMGKEIMDDLAHYVHYAEEAHERKMAKANFRTEIWRTKDGREIPIQEMGDGHLFNAYKHSQNSLLFREMVLRLFEQRMMDK